MLLLRALALCALVALVATCGSDVTAPETVVSVQVTPTAPEVQAGASVQLTATPRSANGNPLSGHAVVWASRDTSIARVSASGVVSGRKQGAATVTATSEGVVGSAVVAVIPGQATELVFTVAPVSIEAGVLLAPPLEVTARDAFGNTATGFTGPVTITIGANPSGATLAGRTTVPAVAGVAVFDSVHIDRSGTGYTLNASASGLGDATSSAFNVGPAGATRLAFTVQPGDPAAATPITPAVRVTALDEFGNTATGFSGTITVSIANNPPGSGVLSGTTSVDASVGVASFGDLSIATAGVGYTLAAAADGLAGTTSAAFTVTPAAAAHLVFTVQPGDATAGERISPAVEVIARDALGNVATGFGGTVTLAIGPNPPGGSGALEGTTSVAAAQGVARFDNLNIDEAGAGYTLTAAASGLTGATSAPFTITPGTASQLTFTVHPSDATAGTAIAPAIEVAARDVFGNTATSFTGVVTVALGANSPEGGVLDGNTSVAAVAGVAAFGDLDIDVAGSDYSLAASAPGLIGATSAAFAIAPGAAAGLAFTVQPGNTIVDEVINPPVEVTARDVFGNTATSFTGAVTVAIGDNPGGGDVSGTTTLNAVTGVASFDDLRIDEVGFGYTLVASAVGLTGDTSTAFSIIDRSGATQLAFTVQPAMATAGLAITPAVVVTVRDSLGNTVPGFSGSITVSVAANPAAGTLSGTTTLASVAGVATFADLSLDRSGSGYALEARASGLVAATTAPFAVAPGPATGLQFVVQPTTTTAGADIAPAVRVRVVDALGNVVPSPERDVTVSLARDPAEATLSGTLTARTGSPSGPDSGVATFNALSIDKAAVGFTLEASSAGLASDTSVAFDVTPGAATQIRFTTQPTTTMAGGTIAPPVQVIAFDALGNTATSFSAAVTVAIVANPGGGTLSGTRTVVAVAGVATFSSLSIDRSASGYTLGATGGGFASGPSAPFAIMPGPASQLAITIQPTESVVDAVITPAVEVRARDALGNNATSFAGTMSLAIGANPGGGSLSGTTARNAVAGVATFPGLAIDRVGSGYTLVASAAGLAGATSAPFNVVAASAAVQLAFTVQPTATTVGTVITPAIEVTARDAQGRPATGFTGTVALVIQNNPAGGTLSGTSAVTAVAGVATFSTLSIDEIGTGYTLRATTAGLTGVTSAAFAVTAPSVVSASLSAVEVSTDTIGACLSPCVVGDGASTVSVTVRDELGATLAGVAVSLSVTPADSTVWVNPGASGVTDAGGIFRADFSAGRAVPRTLSATAGGVALLETATVAVMPVLVGAGDIADCARQADEATANQLDGLPGQVITLGDNVYPDGTADEFANCYDPSWGRHRERSRPTAGNRDYNTPGAAPYYAYFGARANPSGGTGNSQGYYSYDVGTWHIIVLNSEISMNAASPQLVWLRQDLNGRRNQCVLAYWHKPRFASRSAVASVDPLWRTVADSGVDVVLSGHAHLYERFAPMNAAGEASPTGPRLLVVGTGGASLSNYDTDPPNSLLRDNTTHGVLRMTLYADRYRWEFIPAPGFGTFTDSGTGSCN